MEPENERARRFGDAIARLIAGENTTRAEARECWRQICEEEQSDLQQGAFIAAPKARKETPEEVAGTFEAQIRFGSTINIVGPLLNPTMPAYKVMGVPGD